MKTTFGLPKRREEVINLLQQAYADGNLEDEDYEARLTNAMQAKSVEDLQDILRDFPDPPQLLQPRPDSKQASPTAERQPISNAFRHSQDFVFSHPAILSSQKIDVTQPISKPFRLRAILGEQKLNLTHAQVVGEQLYIQTECILGETTIDLRAQGLKGKQVFIRLHNFMGEIKVLLPKGAQIDNQVSPVLGDVNHGSRRVSKIIAKLLGQKPDLPAAIPCRVTLTGNCILGSVSLIHE